MKPNLKSLRTLKHPILYKNMKTLFTLLFLSLLSSQVFSQANPAQREDARIEREKVLRAADQLEILLPQLDALKTEVQALKTQVDRLQLENVTMKKSLSALETSRTKEREALLDEVSKILAESKPAKVAATPAPAKLSTNTTAKTLVTPKPAPPSTNQTTQEQIGYEHVVESGQTVSSIVKAFNEAGVKVTVKDIIQANNLGPDAKVRIGQKLFIPKK